MIDSLSPEEGTIAREHPLWGNRFNTKARAGFPGGGSEGLYYMRAEVCNSAGPIWERTLADKGISMMIKYFRLILSLIYVDVWKLANPTKRKETGDILNCM